MMPTGASLRCLAEAGGEFMRTLLVHAVIYMTAGPLSDGWLLVEDGSIAAFGQGTAPAVSDAAVIDLAGQSLVPGFIDMHTHGALGCEVMDATPEALQAIARHAAQHGVTAFLPTTTAADDQATMAALRIAAAAMGRQADGAVVVGVHLEGPYLNIDRRGAQPAEAVRRADPQEYERYLDLGVIRMITAAPEYPESRTLFTTARRRGIIGSIGHTRATVEEVNLAVQAGASHVTHTFNGMEPLHHRQPGVVGAALTNDALMCELIADNVHLDPTILRLAWRAKGPARLVLVTDAMSGTSMPEGDYVLGGAKVLVHDGQARLPDGTLAGSTLTLERGLRNMMAAAQLSLAEALPLVTSNPARELGLMHKGSIAVGQDADLVALDHAGDVLLTMVGGRVLYHSAPPFQPDSGATQ